MVGSGEIGEQPTAQNPDLPPSSGFSARVSDSVSNSAANAAQQGVKDSSATTMTASLATVLFGSALAFFFL